MRTLPASIGIICLLATVACATPPDFVRDIRPLLDKHCSACHAGDHAKSGLRFDLKAAA